MTAERPVPDNPAYRWQGLTPPYTTIVADPPWALGSINSGFVTSAWGIKYSTMCVEEIATLPVQEIAASASHLYLWTVAATLRDSFAVVEAWGFKPKTVLVWAKPLGLGVRFRQSCEYVVFGDRGPRLPVTRKDVGTWFQWPGNGPGRHSAKPAGFFDVVEQVSPGPYVELFARSPRLGWDHWGNGYEVAV